MKKIGIIGVGKMGTAILNGILSTKLYHKNDIIIYNRTTRRIKTKDITIAANEQELFSQAEIIILAIKPQDFSNLCEKLSKLDNTPIIISIAGGITIAYLEKYFPNCKIIRTMPNLASEINKSVTTISKNKLTTDKDLESIFPIFTSLGDIYLIPEEDMDKTVCFNGSYPAFLYYFINSFIEAGFKSGLSPILIKDMLIKTTKGAISLLEQDKRELTQLISDICSPNGITIAGIKVLEDNNFTEIINEVFNKCRIRSEELGKGN